MRVLFIRVALAGVFLWACMRPATAQPPDIGTRLELFADAYLIARLEGDVRLRVERPEPKEVVLHTDAPWEGNTSAYFTIFQDGDLYRMYYRGSHWDEKARRATHREVTCYAESRDGIHWRKPKLGLFEFGGSKENNIVWDGIGTHCFTPFKDRNPQAPPSMRYKAVSRGNRGGRKGLYAFASSDGIHWRLLAEDPIITEGAFDSQNLAFWDGHAGFYRAYFRGFRSGFRDILTSTSQDFLHWSKPRWLHYPGAPQEHLYTNAILPYERAPHILLGFPTRYLPEEGSRVEPTLMVSRDGVTFHRHLQPLIPKDAPADRAGNRSNYMAWGLVRLPGDDRHYSVYATEAYYTGPDSRLRRFTYRIDGFVAFHGGKRGGVLITKPFRFSGARLVLNYRAAEGGQVRVGLEEGGGQPIAGLTAAQCEPLRGDEIAGEVRWRSGAELSPWRGRLVRLRFEARRADVYSFRFAEAE